MGYRSEVALKTTTEGYILFKMYNDKIKESVDKPLRGMTIERTGSGFYKISHNDIKWYESYKSVENFMDILDKFDEQDIPYSFIRIGEEIDDIEHRVNYTKDDMPDEIATFEPERDINDPEWDYETVKEDEDT